MYDEVKIRRYMEMIDRLCFVTVYLNNKQKEVEETSTLIKNISDLYPVTVFNVQKYNLHLLALKEDLKKLYNEYVNLNKDFLDFAEREEEIVINNIVIRLTNREVDLRQELKQDKALGMPADKTSFISDLLNVYFQYIDTIHFILDERNVVKHRIKTPR